MDNLTDILLSNNYHYQVEEWGKQGGALGFDSGKEQRLVTASIPSFDLTISYRGFNWQQYSILRDAYENNNSNTFIVDASDRIPDLRPDLLGIDGSVWAFKNFRFKVDATQLYIGKITLVTSVFFNFPAYQDAFDQSSTYISSPSDDVSFITVLSEVSPHTAELYYANNAIFSSINQSVRHARNKGGLKRVWKLHWQIVEWQFVKLIKFYRQNAGIMGEFATFDYGHNAGVFLPYLDVGYVEEQDDYIIPASPANTSNSRFLQDSFKYQKQVNGMIRCSAEIIEVKF